MLTIGTILIPTSFIVLGFAVQASGVQREALALASPTLYLMWLYLSQLPVRIMNDAESEVGVLTADPTTAFLRELYGAGHGNTWMMRIRRNQALAYMALLIFAATFVGLS